VDKMVSWSYVIWNFIIHAAAPYTTIYKVVQI